MNTPVTQHGARVLLILEAARAEALDDLRLQHPDLWPAGSAGDRKWSRDRASALRGEVYGPCDRAEARRVRLLDLVELVPGSTTRELAETIGAEPSPTYADLRRAGARAVMRRRDTRGGAQAHWYLDDTEAT